MGQIIAYLSRHRGLILYCLVGLALCGGLAVLLQPREPQLPAYERPQAEAGDYKPGGAQCEEAEIDRLPVGDRQGKRDACAKEREEHRLVEDDLLQQTRSADAAQAIVPLVYHQSQALLYGLVFGAATLLAAVAAAKFARDAAKETKRTADLADADQRPWVSISVEPYKSFNFVGDQAVTTPNIKMTNHGKRVARNVATWAEMYVHGDGEEPIEVRDAALARLHTRVAASLASPKFHRRLIFPGQFACFAPDVRCPSVESDIYRLVVLVGYDFEGSTERHFTWAMFDLLTASNGIINRSEGRKAIDEWMATATGVGDAT